MIAKAESVTYAPRTGAGPSVTYPGSGSERIGAGQSDAVQRYAPNLESGLRIAIAT